MTGRKRLDYILVIFRPAPTLRCTMVARNWPAMHAARIQSYGDLIRAMPE
jgi:hypothetical protein